MHPFTFSKLVSNTSTVICEILKVPTAIFLIRLLFVIKLCERYDRERNIDKAKFGLNKINHLSVVRNEFLEKRNTNLVAF